MRRTRRPAMAGMLIVLALALLGGAAALRSASLRVRLALVALWGTGQIPDLPAANLRMLLAPHSGFDLDLLAATRSPTLAVRVPDRASADSAGGHALFTRACASCHGATARGGAGPALVGRAFARGGSDWAVFRNVTGGIVGTAMPATHLSAPEVWTVIGYLRAAQAAAQAAGPDSSAPRLVLPEDTRALLETTSGGGSWATYSGNYAGHRFAPTTALTPQSIRRLRIDWLYQLPGAGELNESSPLVVGNLMVVTDAQNVWALEASSGRPLWHVHRDVPSGIKLCCGMINRGAAMWGAQLFVGTPDAHLLALDARTGATRWDVAVDDPSNGVSITGAPLAADGKVIVGIAGGEFGVRGHLDAYDANTGARVWRFWTVPAPGEPAASTWPAGALARGGAPAWLTGSYDPATHTLFWGIGNPGPVFAADARRGSNLYSNSLVALDARTGALRWSYQFTPNDSHDWDAAQVPVLAEAASGDGASVVLLANRNGFFYALDRSSGKFLRATPFARQNWNVGFDSAGRPRPRPETEARREGAIVYPGVGGATNWWSPSYDPTRRLLFVAARDVGNIYVRDRALEREDGTYTGGRALPIPGVAPHFSIVALDAASGDVRWNSALDTLRSAAMGGLLATAGGVVFGGLNDEFFALDAASGVRLWAMRVGGPVIAAPVAFGSADGERIAVVAGRTVIAFRLPPDGTALPLPERARARTGR